MTSPNSVDAYFSDGCGRCKLGGTPDCRVHLWTDPLHLLRAIALKSGLEETRKWGVPCYTYEGKNIVLLGAFKGHCIMGFFKGALIDDHQNILTSPGSNSQSMRQARFTDSNQVNLHRSALLEYIQQAVAHEKAGLKIPIKSHGILPVPPELEAAFNGSEELRAAFLKLTPGRRRAYLLHFSQAKQSSTRRERIEKSRPLILRGEGLHDAYQSKTRGQNP